MTTNREQCPSISPEGEQCSKERGHQPKKHQVKRGDRWDRNFWKGGHSGTPAFRQVEDDGYMSEGEWYAYGRFGY